MAIEVLAEVITARRGPWRGGDLLVLMMLASYADPDGTKIFPRVATLARACRMKVRNAQICLNALTADGVVRKVGAATGRPGLFNEYEIDLERLQSLQGCKVCRGAVCDDEGCTGSRGRVQNPVPHIDKRPGPVLDTSSARAAGSVDKPGGAREVWGRIERALGPVKFRSFAEQGRPEFTGSGLDVYYPNDFRAGRAQEIVREMEKAAGMPVSIRIRKVA